MKKQFGFTLSEILLATGILGILIAMITPAIVKISPSVDKAMVRRTYYTITTNVSDMINNSLLYQRFNNTTSEPYEGFDDQNSVTFKGKTFSGNTKFVDLFINHMNIKGSVSTASSNCSALGSSSCKTVYTTNGSKWSFAYYSAGNTFASKILIDTNGDKAPNCYVGKSGDACSDPDVVYDQFRVWIYNNGRVIIDPTDAWAAQAVKLGGSLVD